MSEKICRWFLGQDTATICVLVFLSFVFECAAIVTSLAIFYDDYYDQGIIMSFLLGHIFWWVIILIVSGGLGIFILIQFLVKKMKKHCAKKHDLYYYDEEY